MNTGPVPYPPAVGNAVHCNNSWKQVGEMVRAALKSEEEGHPHFPSYPDLRYSSSSQVRRAVTSTASTPNLSVVLHWYWHAYSSLVVVSLASLFFPLSSTSTSICCDVAGTTLAGEPNQPIATRRAHVYSSELHQGCSAQPHYRLHHRPKRPHRTKSALPKVLISVVYWKPSDPPPSAAILSPIYCMYS